MGTPDAIRIGRYEIRRELGRGVMGVVYEAWDPALGRTIALKTIRPVAATQGEREAWEARFQTEARAAARLSHPAIVVVHDVGRDAESGVDYLALEYLRGQTLAERLAASGRLDWHEALRLVCRIAEGLAHAHAEGVVHRDIKPANIMVLPSGEPKILDFGVARLDAGSLTSPGDLCGTPLFMSPEQAAGEPLDARSDIFSLGAVAWALLTGRSPFDAPSLAAILTRVIHRAPPPAAELSPEVPPEVDRILARAMAKRPEDRYPDARSMAEDIEDILAEKPPRHRAEWQPEDAEQTRVSALAADVLETLEAADGELGTPTRERVPRRRTRWGRLLILVVALGTAAGAYFVLHPEDTRFWKAVSHEIAVFTDDVLRPYTSAQPAPSLAPAAPTPTAAAATPVTTAPATPAISATPQATPSAPSSPVSPAPASPDDRLLPEPEAASATADDTSEPAPTQPPIAESAPADSAPAASNPTAPAPSVGAPSSTAKAAPPVLAPDRARPTPRPARPAYLSISFDHGLKAGTLEVWVDGTRVAKQALDSRVTKKLLLFQIRKGSVQRTLRLDAGTHRVSVRIRAEGQTRSARTTASFRPGLTRRLELRVSRLSQNISLEWK